MRKSIVAVSGGPDSMALLDMLRKEGKDSLFVAHVNYQKRETAYRDEKIVRSYCESHNIPYRILYPAYTKGNFQSWAREVRYAFFQECALNFESKRVYVAHQMDDHIETYIFQKQRNMVCDTFGLSAQVQRAGYEIVRPLLMWEKKELESYCVQNQVPYGIDESNLTNHYTRNQIRHSMMDSMSREEKIEYLKRIDEENRKWNAQKEQAKKFDGDMNKNPSWLELEMFLSKYTKKHYSQKHMTSLLKQLHRNILVELDGYDVENYKGCLQVSKQKEFIHDVYENISFSDQESYCFSKSGKTIESITVSESDFPLTVRTVKDTDSIQLRFGKKNVHRFFVDRKISKTRRKYWLVVENAQGEIIFVPGIGCNVEHFSIKPNLFMLQCNL